MKEDCKSMVSYRLDDLSRQEVFCTERQNIKQPHETSSFKWYDPNTRTSKGYIPHVNLVKSILSNYTVNDTLLP